MRGWGRQGGKYLWTSSPPLLLATARRACLAGRISSSPRGREAVGRASHTACNDTASMTAREADHTKLLLARASHPQAAGDHSCALMHCSPVCTHGPHLLSWQVYFHRQDAHMVGPLRHLYALVYKDATRPGVFPSLPWFTGKVPELDLVSIGFIGRMASDLLKGRPQGRPSCESPVSDCTAEASLAALAPQGTPEPQWASGASHPPNAGHHRTVHTQ